MNDTARRVQAGISRELQGQRLVFGFYHSEEHAREALAETRAKHFLRSAVVLRSEDGHLKFFHAVLAPSARPPA